MSKKVLIIGAGIGGLTAALALKRIGYEPVIFERSPQPSSNGTTLVLWPNAFRVLQVLGVADDIMKLGVRNLKTSVFTAKGQPLYELSLDMEAEYGYPVMTVLRADLQRVLLERLGEGSVVWGQEFVGAKQGDEQVTVNFANGHREQGCLLIGADGIHSKVRTALLGEVPLRFCGFAAYRGMVDNHSTILPQQIGMEVWGEGKRFGLFHTGHQGLYWFATLNSMADSDSSPLGIKQHLLHEFASWHPPVEQILHQTDESKMLRHLIYDIPSLPYWSKGRVTLLGDAAHAMTPNLGQGACQAIEDGMALAESIQGESILSLALQRYEAKRNSQVRKVVSLSNRMGRVSQWSNPMLCGVRNWVFATLPGSMKLKQLERIIGKG
ncbi:NAD(P)-binding protein [Paenibacillus sp. LMG 31456]|uniref:NAD(P)-binding protein n=1 Tax=Paenibacillus foliorum TaxID=2654974 RepID=A0A972GVQ9_9BACL|nr:FAD-dependent monooxygenase [Paenibacillus foliorum]NOU97789.1 NAD(P)-binding protein [Paenibacillus foliorum]